jgi:transposase-like protein
MKEMSVTEQRYKAVLAVIAEGRAVGAVASEWGVCRQTMHRWLARYENDGLEGLGDQSSRPTHCPHQMPAEVEAMVLEMRRAHAYWILFQGSRATHSIMLNIPAAVTP